MRQKLLFPEATVKMWDMSLFDADWPGFDHVPLSHQSQWSGGQKSLIGLKEVTYTTLSV